MTKATDPQEGGINNAEIQTDGLRCDVCGCDVFEKSECYVEDYCDGRIKCLDCDRRIDMDRSVDPSFLEAVKGVCTGETEELFEILMNPKFWTPKDGLVGQMAALEALWVSNPEETLGSARTLIRTLLALEAYSFHWGDGDFGNVLTIWMNDAGKE